MDFAGGSEMLVRFIRRPMTQIRERMARSHDAPTIVSVGDPALHEFAIKVPGKVGLNMEAEEEALAEKTLRIQEALRTPAEQELRAAGKLDLNEVSKVKRWAARRMPTAKIHRQQGTVHGSPMRSQPRRPNPADSWCHV